MLIKTADGTANVAGGGTLSLGVIGTVLGGLAVLNGKNGLNIFGNNNDDSATKSDVAYSQELAKKDSEIALLKSEQNTEVKIADVYDKLVTKINANQREQAEWNSVQAVANANMTAGIAALNASVAGLQSGFGQITKVVIPNSSVCPGWGDVKVSLATAATGA